MLPNHETTTESCITSSLAMPSVSISQAFFHVFVAVRCKQRNGGNQMKGMLPEYQIISINIRKPTYRQILYQAIGKLDGKINIDEQLASNSISIALTDKEEPGVDPIDPTHANIDDECLLVSPPYVLYIFHLTAIE